MFTFDDKLATRRRTDKTYVSTEDKPDTHMQDAHVNWLEPVGTLLQRESLGNKSGCKRVSVNEHPNSARCPF